MVDSRVETPSFSDHTELTETQDQSSEYHATWLARVGTDLPIGNADAEWLLATRERTAAET